MNRLRDSFVVLLMGVMFSALSLAQRGSGSTTLEVKFYVPGGTVPVTTRVELFYGAGTPVGEGVPDVSGRVTFSGLADGNYSVRASGPNIETATYDLRIMPDEQLHVETFQLRPVSLGTAPPNSTSDPAVSVLDLGAPPKAQKEVVQATQALKKQNWAEARKHCEKAIEIYPQFVSAYNELGVILIRLAERSKAREVLQKAISLDPNYAHAYMNLARMDATDHMFAEAEELLKKTVSIDTRNAEALFLLANAQFENGHYDDAIATARKVHALPHQGFEAAHFICAMALEAERRPGEAGEEYRAFLKEAPDSKMAPNARAALQRMKTQ